MDKNDFYNLIDIEDDEIPSAEYYLEHRGIAEHIRVANYLQSFIVNRKVRYCEVATAFRYDKRIRRILYKYLGYLEENIRAYISNNFSNKAEFERRYINSLTEKESEKFKTTSTLNDALSDLLFRKLLYVACNLPQNNIQRLFPNEGLNIDFNKEGLYKLRNKVGHNLFIIDNHNLDYVVIDGDFRSCSLRSNIINLINFLPLEIGKSLSNDINNAIKEKASASPSSCKTWNLVPEICIAI